MNIAKSFTFLLEDERVVAKLGIGVAVMIISILLSPIFIGLVGVLILVGYSVRLLQNVRDGVARPLPEWDRWGEDLVDGLKLVVASLVYAIPIFLFIFPTIIGALIADNSRSGEFVGIPLILCGVCLMLLYGIILMLAQPGIMIAFAREKTIGSALRFGDIWQWTRRNIGPVIIVSLVTVAVSAVIPVVAMVTGVLLLVVGLVVTVPLGSLLISLIQAHLYGQLAAADPMDGTLRLSPYSPAAPAAPAPPAPPMQPVEPFVTTPAAVPAASAAPVAPAAPATPNTVALETPPPFAPETDDSGPRQGLDV